MNPEREEEILTISTKAFHLQSVRNRSKSLSLRFSRIPETHAALTDNEIANVSSARLNVRIRHEVIFKA